MTFEEMIAFTKVYNVVMGIAHPATVSKYEIDLVCETMKKMVDNRRDWTHQQKEIYKLMVDYTKSRIEGR